MDNIKMRAQYVGAVSLLCRTYSRLTPEVREDLEADGSMERLAADFNAEIWTMRMERASGGRGLFTVDDPQEPPC